MNYKLPRLGRSSFLSMGVLLLQGESIPGFSDRLLA
jgi:hypothetical protein